MFLDADEVLVEEDVERLRALRGKTWREAFYLTEISYTGELGDGTAATHTALRVFRARPEYRFSGRLHEQIADTLPLHLPERIERDRHPRRALRLPRRGARREGEVAPQHRAAAESSATTGESDPFLHFNLGSEYGAVGDAAGRAGAVRARVGADRQRPERAHLGLHAGARLAARARAAHLRPPRGLHRARRTRDSRATPASPTSSSSRPPRRWRSATPTAALRLYRECIAMGDAPSKYTATVGHGHVPADDRDRRDPPRARRDRPRRSRCSTPASPSTPASSAWCCRSRRRCWPTASRPTRSSRASRRAWRR